MCEFCEGRVNVDTTVGDYELKMYLNEDCKELLNVRISQGSIGMIRPILIKFCPFCGEKLIKKIGR